MTKKEEREFIFNKFDGKCSYCGCELKKVWHVDHKEPIGRRCKYLYDKLDENYEPKKEYYLTYPERDNLDNKYPSCPSCNINKHGMGIGEFRKSIKGYIKSLNRDSTQYKVAKRFNLIKETDKEVTFFFEKYKNN